MSSEKNLLAQILDQEKAQTKEIQRQTEAIEKQTQATQALTEAFAAFAASLAAGFASVVQELQVIERLLGKTGPPVKGVVTLGTPVNQ